MACTQAWESLICLRAYSDFVEFKVGDETVHREGTDSGKSSQANRFELFL